MHRSVSQLYECGCETCKTTKLSVEEEGKTLFEDVLNAAKKAFKHLVKIGSYNPTDLKDKAYKELITATTSVFNKTIRDNVVSQNLQTALESDAFLFGSLKVHAQLFEASKLLLDENGKRKSFQQLQQELDKLNVEYNNNYLEAEYQFATSAAVMADKWVTFSDRYDLQYRTASDSKVREEHQALHGITLPKDDAFWQEYYPPNGWRCRCTVVQVRKDKYEESDSKAAIKAGEKATQQIGKDGKNKLEMFRFNAGQSKKLFPKTHPYNKVKGADAVKENLKK